MNQPLMAFWRYDSFPYLLGGTVTKMRDDGSVETKEYGVGTYFKPALILPVSAGTALRAELQAREGRHDDELRALRRRHEQDLMNFLAPYNVQTPVVRG